VVKGRKWREGGEGINRKREGEFVKSLKLKVHKVYKVKEVGNPPMRTLRKGR